MKALEQVLPPPAQARLLRAIKSGSKYRNTSDEGMFGLTDGSWMEVTDDVDEAEEIAAEMVALARERTGEADATMQEGKVKAEKHRDGLLARTKKATAVIDEQGDFYEYESNRWMDAREKELARQRAEAVEEFIQAKRKQRLLEITFGPGGEVCHWSTIDIVSHIIELHHSSSFHFCYTIHYLSPCPKVSRCNAYSSLVYTSLYDEIHSFIFPCLCSFYSPLIVINCIDHFCVFCRIYIIM